MEDRGEVCIDDLGRDGRGVGRLGDGRVVFVPGALPGDRVEVLLSGRPRGPLTGRVLRLVVASPDRRRPPCILADHCGGCTLQPLSDAAQQRWKQAMVAETLRRVGGIQAAVHPLLACPQGLGYRNRAVIPLERSESGSLRAGYYRRGTHRIVNMNRCPVLDPAIDALIAPLKRDLEATGWPVHHHGPGLRHLALRVGRPAGGLLLTLISSHDELPGLEELAAQWMERWPALAGVTLNLQRAPTNVLFGPENRVIRGVGWVEEEFAGLRFRIAADTFFQVHSRQAERIVPLLLEALAEAPGPLVDAYCGIGTFSLPLAAAGWQVHGIEQHPDSVDLARANAEANGLGGRARFEAAPVGAVLAERLEGATALLLDPPRKGLEARDVETIRAIAPPRVAYLSCDPATLARDLSRLCGEGRYRVPWVQPVDFFPNTSHVEALALLERA